MTLNDIVCHFDNCCNSCKFHKFGGQHYKSHTLVGNGGTLVGDIIDTNYELTKESIIAIVNTYSTS
jgi:hypothetical protein